MVFVNVFIVAVHHHQVDGWWEPDSVVVRFIFVCLTRETTTALCVYMYVCGAVLGSELFGFEAILTFLHKKHDNRTFKMCSSINRENDIQIE